MHKHVGEKLPVPMLVEDIAGNHGKNGVQLRRDHSEKIHNGVDDDERDSNIRVAIAEFPVQKRIFHVCKLMKRDTFVNDCFHN